MTDAWNMQDIFVICEQNYTVRLYPFPCSERSNEDIIHHSVMLEKGTKLWNHM